MNIKGRPKPLPCPQEVPEGRPKAISASQEPERRRGRGIAPDFTYGSPEEYFYCCWIAERQPPVDHLWLLWLEERRAFMADMPAWVKAWRRAVNRQRALKQQP